MCKLTYVHCHRLSGLSINLAILNILAIPALDCGRGVVLGVGKLRGKAGGCGCAEIGAMPRGPGTELATSELNMFAKKNTSPSATNLVVEMVVNNPSHGARYQGV